METKSKKAAKKSRSALTKFASSSKIPAPALIKQYQQHHDRHKSLPTPHLNGFHQCGYVYV
jgi:hypothetical protein